MSDSVDLTWSALADPTRRALVVLLGQGAHSPGELADELGTTRPAVSRHLKVLRQAGLVEERIDAEDGRRRVCALRPDRLAELRDWIDRVEAFWTDQLAAFKAHAERR